MTKHFSLSASGGTSAPIGAFGRKSGRTGFLALIIDALHHSRRLEARRFLRAHGHLVGNRPDICLSSDTGGERHVDH